MNMSDKYVQIIVDISAADVNQVYDYKIPENLKNNLDIGHVVRVPFGNRSLNGFVVGFTEKPEIEKSKIKTIQEKIVEEKLFDCQMLKLFKYLAYYYHSYLIKIIKTAIPTGVSNQSVNKKKKSFIKLTRNEKEINNYIKEIKKKAPKQARVLKICLNNPDNKFTVNNLAEKANCYRGAIYSLIDKNYLQYYNLTVKRKPFLEKNESDSKFLKPTEKQQEAINAVNNNLKEHDSKIFLLHGVTGSGKTEVYLNLIQKTLQNNQGAIVLVPEISLTPVMARRFYSRFEQEIAILHSQLSLGERYDEWRRIKNGEAKIVIGARSAIFAPVKNPGLIIIDEEHENSYKQNKYPYYHTRKVAFIRARMWGCSVVLGSATPSVESYYYAKKNYFKYLSLPKRINSKNLPPVEIVDMRKEIKKGNTGIFSEILKNSIKKALGNNEQILIFLNRRGHSSFVLCRDCGFVIRCKNCDISLTYHADNNILKCHYCDFSKQVPAFCPDCESKYIKNFGIGTQKIEEQTRKLFPEAAIERMDVDTTRKKNSYRKILNRIENGETDILIGTQMIAKGHDYPNISVVGVISTDIILNLPDFRSSERTFQLLTQVAGRTGRGKKKGKVIFQSYSPGHYSIQAAKDHDYSKFFHQEIKLRKQLNYPPFSYLVNIIIKGEDRKPVRSGAIELGLFLNKYNKKILKKMGPSAAPLTKLHNKYRWQIILKFENKKLRSFVVSKIEQDFLSEKSRNINFNIDVDPVSML